MGKKSIGKKSLGAAGMAVVLLVGATACGSAKESDDSGSGDSGGTSGTIDQGFKVGLLLPETKTARYEKFDKPYITDKVKALCPKCEVVYANANQDPNLQQQQVDTMLTNGAKVLILDAVDAKAISSSVSKANGQGVKVVAYDRLATGPISAYTSFDNLQVGKLQGQALLDAIKKGGDAKRGPIVMINGSPTDPNAGDFKKGAHSVLDGQVTIGKEYDTPDWSPDKAAVEADGAFTALGAKKVVGVYSANDGMAGGIAKSMANAGVPTGTPLTGQDAELAAIQRIMLGTQTMTIYKPIKPEAEAAAQMAIDLGSGKTPSGNQTVATVPAQIITPQVVTKDNVKDTVVKDNFWTVQEICTSQVAAACKSAGLT
ncbi:sugar ABC transporter substrate-binding protein [Actinocorallia longicatena]|uniref:Sugar ABC transporter substrate-binding protein n=1 Tax=Actinocorallia longicatena TaxID=111803 RepID=A0ABP6QDY0_9ACTN